jgi:hypothetical protein
LKEKLINNDPWERVHLSQAFETLLYTFTNKDVGRLPRTVAGIFFTGVKPGYWIIRHLLIINTVTNNFVLKDSEMVIFQLELETVQFAKMINRLKEKRHIYINI